MAAVALAVWVALVASVIEAGGVVVVVAQRVGGELAEVDRPSSVRV
jgi:hypothetical protein